MKQEYFNMINRRQFLQTGVKVSVSAFLTTVGAVKLFGSSDNNVYDKANTPIKYVTLNNGVKMPIIGFGTLTLTGEKGAASISDALSLGYRLIDTATIYNNEDAVGEGIRLSGVSRDKLFVTSKVWVDDSGYENTKKAFETSLNKMGLDYLDLYLIHRPRGDIKGTWKAMEELYRNGRIRAIGVSNFEPDQLKELNDFANIKPAVNQIEAHAFFHQPEALSYLSDNNIQMEAWSPFAQGRNNHFVNETLANIGKKYNKTNAQVSLRWHYQRGVVTIPRTSKVSHMKENLNIFDFALDKSDMDAISQLDINTTQFPEWE
ncbi:aldo/keto reductase [Marinilabiliaceae bacterium ANBcel2]|nr:aldo/keto reductase [Marinilabiliaceae bacterium ANBcel2]